MRVATTNPSNPPETRVARAMAVVAGTFTVAVALLLAANHLQDRLADPLNSPALQQLFRDAARAPQDVRLRDEARALDLLARRAFFSSRAFGHAGAFLLLGGSIVLLIALRAIASREKLPPAPGDPVPTPEAEVVSRTRTRRALATVGATLAGAVAMWCLLVPAPELAPLASGLVAPPGPGAAGSPATPSPSPAAPAAPAAAPAPASADAGPTAAEIESNWPSFRGPYGNGVAPASAAPPTDWDGPSGKAIVWKVAGAGAGFNSPLIWGERLLLTSGTEQAREILCFHTGDGRLLWRHDVKPAKPGAELPEVGEDTGFAAPSAATDGRRVCAIFATGDLACVDLEGKALWQVSFGNPDNAYGHGSSLLIWRGLVLVQYDQGDQAHLMAFHCADGRPAWKVKREVDPSWASPILVPDVNPPQVVLNASPHLAGHDALTGRELWRCEPISGEIASSPARAGRLVFAGNEGGALLAVDLATGAKVWETEDDLPDVASPVAARELLFLPSSAGVVTCRKTADGTVAWRQEYDEGFYASPVVAGGMVYLLDRKGLMHIVRAAPQYAPVRDCPLGEEVVASPAFKGNRIYLRGVKSLYCIGDGSR